MGNIITQTENDERSYIVNEDGDFQVKNKFNANTGTINNFTADTGTFNNVVYFKDNITIADNKTINNVDLPAFKTDYENKILEISSGKFLNNLDLTAKNGNFAKITTSFIDVDGNIKAKEAAFSGLITANGGLNVNGTGGLTSTSGNFTDGVTSTTGKFLGMLSANGGLSSSSGQFTDGLTVEGTNGFTSTTGKFTGLLLANGGLQTSNANITDLSGTSGTFSGIVKANGGLQASNANITELSGTTGTFSGLLSADDLKLTKNFIANGGITLPNDSTLTLNGNMTGTGNINLGTTLQINQTTLPVFAGKTTKMTGNNGLLIKGENTWSIGEVKGTSGTSRLCFSYNDIPFACIDPVTKNLVGVSKEW